jgi:hypothetical protein
MAMHKQSADASKISVPLHEKSGSPGHVRLTAGELRSLHGFAEPAPPTVCPPRTSLDPHISEVAHSFDLMNMGLRL